MRRAGRSSTIRALPLIFSPPLVALLHVGCPSGGGGGAAVGSGSTAGAGSAGAAAAVTSEHHGPDLSYVKAGQRWIYELRGGAVELVLTITSVGPGRVSYDVRSVLVADGARQSSGPGQPLEHRWTASEKPRRLPAASERVVVRGPGEGRTTTLECAIEEADGVRRWSAVAGAEPAFPPEVRVVRGGVVERELVRIE